MLCERCLGRVQPSLAPVSHAVPTIAVYGTCGLELAACDARSVKASLRNVLREISRMLGRHLHDGVTISCFDVAGRPIPDEETCALDCRLAVFVPSCPACGFPNPCEKPVPSRIRLLFEDFVTIGYPDAIEVYPKFQWRRRKQPTTCWEKICFATGLKQRFEIVSGPVTEDTETDRAQRPPPTVSVKAKTD